MQYGKQRPPLRFRLSFVFLFVIASFIGCFVMYMAKMRHSSLWLNGRRNFRPVVRWSKLMHGLNNSIAGMSIPKTDIGMWKPMSRFW